MADLARSLTASGTGPGTSRQPEATPTATALSRGHGPRDPGRDEVARVDTASPDGRRWVRRSRTGLLLIAAAAAVLAAVATTAGLESAGHRTATPTANTAEMPTPAEPQELGLRPVGPTASPSGIVPPATTAPATTAARPSGASPPRPRVPTLAAGGNVVPAVPLRFAGVWVGVLFMPPGSTVGYATTITMSSGSRTADFALPGIGCRAVLTPVAVSPGNTGLLLNEQITVDPSRGCAPRARLTLALNPRGGSFQLTAFWQDAADPANTAAGTLTRQ